MTVSSDGDAEERSRAEAADWFARMRSPGAAAYESELAAWRAGDPQNDAAYERLLRRWDQSAFLTNSSLGRGRDLSRASAWSRRPVMRNAALAASIVLVAGIGVLAIDRDRLFPQTATPIDYASTDGQIRAITLADGARITLDAGSVVKVDTVPGERRVRLVRGRARFELERRSGTRLVVSAGGGSVLAEQGQFDVSLSARIVRVVAWKGDLDVSGSGPGERVTRITAGQEISFDPSGVMAMPSRADSGELGWARGMLSFNRARLADAVLAFNRHEHGRIVLGSAAIGDLRITGAFSASDPQGFARAVADMFHLSLGTTSDGAILLSPEKKA